MSLRALNGLPHESDTTAEGAAMYAALGWAVFPCAGKVPILADGFKGASSDGEKVAVLWKASPLANIGWSLPVEWFALDVDPRHGGDVSLAELQREHGPLPLTLRARTGGGGEHWVYRVPTGVEIKQAVGFRPGLDTRLGGRGYLLIAPSVHPETKQKYRWTAVVEPVEPPGWLVELVRAPKPVERVPYVPPSSWTRETEKRRRYGLAALRGCADDVRTAGKGERNDALNKAWFRMAQLKDVVTRSEAEAVLLDAAITVGLSEHEARKVMR